MHGKLNFYCWLRNFDKFDPNNVLCGSDKRNRNELLPTSLRATALGFTFSMHEGTPDTT